MWLPAKKDASLEKLLKWGRLQSEGGLTWELLLLLAGLRQTRQSWMPAYLHC